MATISYTRHALIRMLERKILRREVTHVLRNGEVIEDYLNDKPLPSRLLLCCVQGRYLHVVSAYDKIRDEEVVITLYEPDLTEWLPEFKVRKNQ